MYEMKRFSYYLTVTALLQAVVPLVGGFVVPQQSVLSPTTAAARTTLTPSLHMLPSAADVMASSSPLLETSIASSLTLIAETQAWVQPTATFLDPFLNLMSFAMLARVVLSWYPEAKETQMPWVLLVYPTEPLLRVAKGFVPPAFGVDIVSRKAVVLLMKSDMISLKNSSLTNIARDLHEDTGLLVGNLYIHSRNSPGTTGLAHDED